MSLPYKIGIFGGDKRYVYLTEALLNTNHKVYAYNIENMVEHPDCYKVSSLAELFKECDILIGPIPMTRNQIHITSNHAAEDMTITNIRNLLEERHCLIGGNIPNSVKLSCVTRSIPYFDLMSKETITILNAIATAEGAIMEAILNSQSNLHGSKCLILGYGRCGKILAQKLKGLDASVTIAARSKEALAYASAYGLQVMPMEEMKNTLSSYLFIFNTIPVPVIDKDSIDQINPNCLIIDIASAPGGTDFSYASERNIKAKLCLGLPGKVAPKSSADILFNEIIAYLKERSD